MKKQMLAIDQKPKPTKAALLVVCLLFIAGGIWSFSQGSQLVSLQFKPVMQAEITFVGGSPRGVSLLSYKFFSDNRLVQYWNTGVVFTMGLKKGDIVQILFDKDRRLAYVKDLLLPNAIAYLTLAILCWLVSVGGFVKIYRQWSEEKRTRGESI